MFCLIVAGKSDPELIAYRDEQTLVVPSLLQAPDNLGHFIVVPI